MKVHQIGGHQLKSYPLSLVAPEIWGGSSSKASILDLYETVPWLNRGVNLVAQTMARMPYSYHRRDTDEELPPEQIVGIDGTIRLPKLLDEIAGFVWLFGAAYVVKEVNRFGIIKGLRSLHPATIRPEYDAQNGLTHYTRTITQSRRYQPDELCAIWLPNRRSEIGPGTSPAAAALAAASVLSSLDKFGDSYFRNGAIYPTLISLSADAGDSDVERMRSWYQRMLSGVRNAFRLEVVRGEVKHTQIGYPVKDLAVPDLTKDKREDIATALGIPQTLLYSNAANYATAREDTLGFYDRTIIPLSDLIAGSLNDYLFAALNLTLKFHPERLEIFQQVEAKKAAAIVSLYTSGIMGLGEVRQKMDLPPEPPDDLIRRPEPLPPSLPAPLSSDNPISQMLEEDENHLDDTVKMARNDWRKWERMAARRISEGKSQKALAFESAVIPPTLAAAVRGCLALAETTEDVHLIFAESDGD